MGQGSDYNLITLIHERRLRWGWGLVSDPPIYARVVWRTATKFGSTSRRLEGLKTRPTHPGSPWWVVFAWWWYSEVCILTRALIIRSVEHSPPWTYFPIILLPYKSPATKYLPLGGLDTAHIYTAGMFIGEHYTLGNRSGTRNFSGFLYQCGIRKTEGFYGDATALGRSLRFPSFQSAPNISS